MVGRASCFICCTPDDFAVTIVLRALQEWKFYNPINFSGTVFPLEQMETAHKRLSRIISTHFPGRSVHALRHTFATLLLSETGDVSLVAHILGDTIATVSLSLIHI